MDGRRGASGVYRTRVMNERSASGRRDVAITALVITSIVATGVIVAGLTAEPEKPQLTVQPVTTTPVAPAPLPEDYVVVTPEVTYPTSIPGCDTVEEPEEATSFAVFGTESPSYDNPIAPWFSGPKAHLMSGALIEALPSDIEFTGGRIPYFDPIPVYDDVDFVMDSTNASSDVSLDGKSGFFSVAVSRTSDGPPPCVAGRIDERRTRSDGTVVDSQTTWEEVNGERTSNRSVTAYVSDGSQVSVYTSAAGEDTALPMSVDQLTAVATDPALRTSVAPPPGTPGNTTECGPRMREENSRTFNSADIESLNSALVEADTGALIPEPPLGALRTTSWESGLCQVVNSAAGKLTISVSDAPVPEPSPPDSEFGSYVSGTTVYVPTPSGLLVTVDTENRWAEEDLQRIARTPGLDLS